MNSIIEIKEEVQVLFKSYHKTVGSGDVEFYEDEGILEENGHGVDYGSGLVRKDSTDKSSALLRLNIGGFGSTAKSAEKALVKKFVLILIVNNGQAMIEQTLQVAAQNTAIDIDLEKLGENLKSPILWNEIFKIDVRITPLHPTHGVEYDQTKKFVWSFLRIPPQKKIQAWSFVTHFVRFKTLQAIALYPQKKFASKNRSVGEIFKYGDNYYSETYFELSQWNKHSYYSLISKIYRFDELEDHPSQNKISEAKMRVSELENNSEIQQNFIPIGIEFLYIDIFDFYSGQGWRDIETISNDLMIVEPTYYDYKSNSTKRGVNNIKEFHNNGFQVPYNFDGDLKVTIDLEISTFFKEIELQVIHSFEKPLLDVDDGLAHIVVDESSKLSPPENPDYVFNFDSSNLKDVSIKDEFNWDDLEEYIETAY